MGGKVPRNATTTPKSAVPTSTLLIRADAALEVLAIGQLRHVGIAAAGAGRVGLIVRVRCSEQAQDGGHVVASSKVFEQRRQQNSSSLVMKDGMYQSVAATERQFEA